MRGRSNFTDFVNNFNAAYDTSSKVAQDWETAQVARAAPEQSQGFTQEQGQQLQAAADSGQYDIGTKMNDDGSFAGYTVTAKSDPASQGLVAQQGVTDFLGKRYAGGLDEGKIDTIRSRAVADVIGKYDPVQGLQLKRQAKQDERDDMRWGRQEKEWQQADDVDALDKNITSGWEQSLVGDDGKRRDPTIDDYVSLSQKRALELGRAGFTKEAQAAFKEGLSNAHIKMQLDAEERNKALGDVAAAVGAGDYGAAAAFYNKYVPSGMKVGAITPGKDGSLSITGTALDGQPVTKQLKNQGELLSLFGSLKDPMALYNYSQGEFRNQLALNADKRAGAAEGRAAASAARENNERTQKMEVLGKIATEAGMTPTQVQGVRLGVLGVPGTEKEKYNYDPTKIAKAFGETSVDELTGKETVKRNQGEEQRFGQWWAANPSIKDADHALVEYNKVRAQGQQRAQNDAQQATGLASEALSAQSIAENSRARNLAPQELAAQLEKAGVKVPPAMLQEAQQLYKKKPGPVYVRPPTMQEARQSLQEQEAAKRARLAPVGQVHIARPGS